MSPRARVSRRRAASAALLGVLLMASPCLVAAGSTFLSMTSDPGDWIGQGGTYFLTPADGSITVTGSPTGVQFSFDSLPASWWTLIFIPPASGAIAPGVFEGATRFPFQSPTTPGLDVSGNSRGCNQLVGRFVVLEAVFGPNGTVTSFAADFEQHCELGAPALIGSVRFNSSIGAGPRISVANASSYEGDGEPKSLGFVVSLSARSLAGVSVAYATQDGTAKAGTDYAATSGTVLIPPGQTAALVDVPILGNTLAEPDRALLLNLSDPAGAPIGFGQATGTVLDDDTGKTFIDFASDPGDYIGLGQTFTLTPLDGTIAAERTASGVALHFRGSTWWDLTFNAPTGSTLVPGVYEVPDLAGLSPVRPALGVSGDGRGCGGYSGRFVVLEAKYSAAGDVQALAIDYEQHCYGEAPALFGSVRFNSLVERGPRISVASAAVFEGDGEPNALTFRLSLSTRVATDVSVDFATADGTAHAGTDYTTMSGNLVIPAGQTVAQVKVPVLGNTVAQPDRGLAFTLDNAAGAPLAFGVVGGTIVDDDALRSLIRFDSEEGEYIGAGKHFALRPPLDGVISTLGGANDLEVRFNGISWWSLHFSPPAGRTLTVGAFEGATQWPVQPPTTPGIALYGDGRGCYSTGRFDVLQADYGPGGEVQALAIDAEQHCDGSPPALFVSIRINSTIPVVKRPAPPALAIAFGASDIPLGGTTSLTFKVTNPNPQDVLTGVAVQDALPAGLVVSTPGGVSGACGGGIVTADPGTGSVTLSGATLFGGASCTFSVNVTGATGGFKKNTATVTTAETAPGKPATANLKVGLPPPFLFFASDPGDPVGLGQTFTFTPADGTLTVVGGANYISVSYMPGPPATSWFLQFSPPAGVTMAPGVYEGATRWPPRSPVVPGLSVYGFLGCGELTGRFVVLEADFGPAGTMNTLAIDYEQHCDGAAPALFGSIRYNSLLPVTPRISVAPALAYEGDGEPKNLSFMLSISARAAGPVSVDYATTDDSAKAGTDYTATSGTVTFPAGQTSVRVDVPVLGNTVAQPDRKLSFALSNASGAPLAFPEAVGTILDDDVNRTFLDFASDPGDRVGGGNAVTLTPLDGTFAVTTYSFSSFVSVSFTGTTDWTLNFAAPGGRPLAPGVYEGAAGPSPSPTVPGLSVYNSNACAAYTGRFVVLEVEYGTTGEVLKFAVDFEQHCDGAAPTLLGSFRYNSLLSTAPRLSVAGVTAFEGNGASSSLGFVVSLSRRSASGVSFGYATADGSAKAGTDYVATAGSASLPAGQTSKRIDVPILANRTVQPDRTLTLTLAGVTGAPLGFGQAPGVIKDDDGARTLLYLDSDPGDLIGQGRRVTLTDLDGTMAPGGSLYGIYAQFRGATNWSLTFSPPPDAALAPGTYEGASMYSFSSPPTPGLFVYGGGQGCSTVSGRFVVHEIGFGTSGLIDALAIDFEQHCDRGAPALFGSIRYNSSVPVVPRAAAAGIALLAPCRVLDTRLAGGPLRPNVERTFPVAGTCGVPATATALIANVTVTSQTQPGSVTIYRADSARPLAATITFPAGRTRANNALIGVSSDGTASIKAALDSTGTADVILDVSGYFR